MSILFFIFLAALLAWAGAQWSRSLPYYEEQQRAIPHRTLVAILLASLATGGAVWQSDALLTRFFLTLWCVVFVLVTVIDIETHYIPNVLILPATGAALLASLIDPRLSWPSALLGAAAGWVVFYLIALVARGGFGMGDVKLAAFVGAVTGLPPLLYVLVAGIFAGGVGALLLLATNRVSRRSYMPYGPYLCFGGWLGILPVVLRFWGILQ